MCDIGGPWRRGSGTIGGGLDPGGAIRGSIEKFLIGGSLNMWVSGTWSNPFPTLGNVGGGGMLNGAGISSWGFLSAANLNKKKISMKLPIGQLT